MTASESTHCMARLLRSRFFFGGLPLALVLGFLFVLTSTATIADAAPGVDQGVVVPENPRRDLPVVVDGSVLAHAQVGDRIFVGGEFTQVRLPNGTTINQPYLFAYNINTGELDQNFRPELNGFVFALETRRTGDGLYVGGTFSRWDNSFPLRIARLDATGNLDTSFEARASARVESIVDVGNSVYLGGDFLDVSGHSVTGLAKVARNSGAVDTRFSPQFTNLVNGSNIVRTIGATPDGSSLFVMHYARQVNGQSRQAVAKFDINNNNPTLSGWKIPWSAQSNGDDCQVGLRDMAISPNGNWLVIGGQGGDNPPNCDSVIRYQTAGDSTVNFIWAARMYSSVFSLAVSDVAVYAGGHFCAAPRNGAPRGGVTSSFDGQAGECEVNNPNSPLNPSQIDPTGAVFRNQLAALNPFDGQALPWNPGSNNAIGVFDLTLIDRGLLAGHDNNRFNSFAVGRSGFFDITPNAVTPPVPGTEVVELECSARVNNAGDVVLDWNSIPGESTYIVRDDDGFVATVNNGTAFTDRNPTAGQRTYLIRYRDGGRDISTSCSPSVTIGGGGGGGAADCAALANDGNVALDWDAVPGESTYVVRDSDGFVATVTNRTAFTVRNPGSGNQTYLVRYRANGQNVDIACGTVNAAGGADCSVSVNDGNVFVDWDAVPGESTYVVRDSDGFVATVNNRTAFTDRNPGGGNQSYLVRYSANGQNVDIACGTVNP